MRDLKGFHGKLFFQVRDGTHGVELWKSDGTVEGTRIVKAINPSSTGNRSLYFENAAGTLFFAVDDGVHGSVAGERRRPQTPNGADPIARSSSCSELTVGP
jgi:ELWxxDGT repeat protein